MKRKNQKTDNIKFVSADKFIDRVYGKIGSPERDAIEAEIYKELNALKN